MCQRHRIMACIITIVMYFVATLGSATEVTVPKFSFKEPNRRFDPRKTIVVSIRRFNPERYSNLRARLFFKLREDLIAHPLSKVKSCFVYDDLIIESDRLTFTRAGIELNDLIYSVPERAKYCLVVFEEGVWKPGPLMIEREAVKEYFTRGFQFVLQGPARKASGIRMATNPEVRREERDAAARNRVVTASLADENRVCIHFRSRNDRTLIAQGASVPTPAVARTNSATPVEAPEPALLLNRLLAGWGLVH